MVSRGFPWYNLSIPTKQGNNKMSKPLNLTDEQRNVTVTFNLNRYEVYIGNMFLTAAQTKADLKEQLKLNKMNAMFDGIAQRMYLAGY